MSQSRRCRCSCGQYSVYLLTLEFALLFTIVKGTTGLGLGVDVAGTRLPDADLRSDSPLLGSDLLNRLKELNNTNLDPEMKKTLAHYLVSQALAGIKNSNVNPPSPSSPVAVAAGGEGTNTAASSTNIKAPNPSTEPPTPTTTSTTTTLQLDQQQQQQASLNESQAAVLSQVNKILQNVATLNVVGIVNESIATLGPEAEPVRDLVGGFLQTLFCNAITGLFNRCTPPSRQPAALPPPLIT